MKTSHLRPIYIDEMKLILKPGKPKAYHTKSPLRWCQTNQFLRMVECNSLREIEANIDLMVHLKGELDQTP